MPELERTLSELGRELVYPPTPDLAATVAERLKAAPARRARLPAARRLALAAAGLALLLAGGAAAFPGARQAILEWVGIEGVEIRVVPQPPDVVPGATLALGERLALREAEARTGLRARLPRALGPPEAAYASEGRLTLRFGALLLTEALSETATFQKQIGPGTNARPVSVGGLPGVYIEGATHGVRVDGGELRVAGDTLLWSSRTLLFRLEGAGSRAEALRIARSVP